MQPASHQKQTIASERDISPMRPFSHRRLLATTANTIEQNVLGLTSRLKTDLPTSSEINLEPCMALAFHEMMKELKSTSVKTSPENFIGAINDLKELKENRVDFTKYNEAEKVAFLHLVFEYVIAHFGRQCDFKSKEVQKFLKSFSKSIHLNESVIEYEEWLKAGVKALVVHVPQNELVIWRLQVAFDVFFHLIDPLEFGELQALSKTQKKLKLLRHLEAQVLDSEILIPLGLKALGFKQLESTEFAHHEVRQMVRYLEHFSLSYPEVLGRVVKLSHVATFTDPASSRELLASLLLKSCIGMRTQTLSALFQLFVFLGNFFLQHEYLNFIKKYQEELRQVFTRELKRDFSSSWHYWKSKSIPEWRSEINFFSIISHELLESSRKSADQQEIGKTIFSTLLEQFNAKRSFLHFEEHDFILTKLLDLPLPSDSVKTSALSVLEYLHLNATKSLKEGILSQEQEEQLKCRVINALKISEEWLSYASDYAQDYLQQVVANETKDGLDKTQECVTFLGNLLGNTPEIAFSMMRSLRYQLVIDFESHCGKNELIALRSFEILLALIKANFIKESGEAIRPSSDDSGYLKKILKVKFFSLANKFELLNFFIEEVPLSPCYLDEIILDLFTQISNRRSSYFDCQTAVLFYSRALESKQTLMDPINAFNSLAIGECGAADEAEVGRFLKTFEVNTWLASLHKLCCFIEENDGESSAPTRVRLKVLRALNHQIQEVLGQLTLSQVRLVVNSLNLLKLQGDYSITAHSEFAKTLLEFYIKFKKSPENGSVSLVDLCHDWMQIFRLGLHTFEEIVGNTVKKVDQSEISSADVNAFFQMIFDLTSRQPSHLQSVESRFKAQKLSSTITVIRSILALIENWPKMTEWCFSTLLNEANRHTVLYYEDLFSLLQLLTQHNLGEPRSQAFAMNHFKKLESLANKSFRSSTAFTDISLDSHPFTTRPFQPMLLLLEAYIVKWELNSAKCRIYYFKNWMGACLDSIARLSKLEENTERSKSKMNSLLRAIYLEKAQERIDKTLALATECHKKLPRLFAEAKEDSTLTSKEVENEIGSLEKSCEDLHTTLKKYAEVKT